MGGKIIDLVGIENDRFKVTKFMGIDKTGNKLWKCKCKKCGNIEIITTTKFENKKGCSNCGWEVKSKRIDLTNQKFGMLKAIKFLEMKNGKSYWVFKCDCGNMKEALAGEVKRGKLSSCGCFRGGSGRIKKKHGDFGTKFYKFWLGLKYRCTNKNNRLFHCYGGRGIIYDPRWEKYEKFKKDMYQEYLKCLEKYPDEILSIERKNVNGNYCKKNCTFIPLRNQQGNRQNNKWFKAISPDSKMFISKNAEEFARQHDLTSSHIRECLKEKSWKHKGWTFRYLVKIKKIILKRKKIKKVILK